MRFTDSDAEAGKEHIAWHARKAWGNRRPLTGPVVVRVVCIFAVPTSWPEALRRAAAEARVMHVADPDLDQLVKQVKDALKGIAYVDDNQVCGYPNSAKRYGSPERTDVTIEALDQRPDEITPGQKRLEKRIANEGWDAVLAPPKRRKVADAPVAAREGGGRPRAKYAGQTKSKSKTRPAALQQAIDAALERDASTRPPTGGLFGGKR
ncbi:MAG: RusA family crossover junction endodeoxyribonuclease [Allosphingosinicella sp.]